MDVEASLLLYPSREPLTSIQKTLTMSHRYETEGTDSQRTRVDDTANSLIDHVLRDPDRRCRLPLSPVIGPFMYRTATRLRRRLWPPPVTVDGKKRSRRGRPAWRRPPQIGKRNGI